MRQGRRLFSYAVFALAAALGCGGAGSDSPSNTVTTPPAGGNTGGTAPNTVNIVELSFSPATMNVSAGSTVTWAWPQCDSGSGGYGGYGACVMHSVTFDDGVSSPTQDSGTFTRTFAAPGTYKYHCSVHGSVMSGEVVVK